MKHASLPLLVLYKLGDMPGAIARRAAIRKRGSSPLLSRR